MMYSHVLEVVHAVVEVKVFISAVLCRLVLCASDMILFKWIFVSSKFTAGELELSWYSSLSPSTIMRTQ